MPLVAVNSLERDRKLIEVFLQPVLSRLVRWANEYDVGHGLAHSSRGRYQFRGRGPNPSATEDVQSGTPDLHVFVITKDELRGWIRAIEWILCSQTCREPSSTEPGPMTGTPGNVKTQSVVARDHSRDRSSHLLKHRVRILDTLRISLPALTPPRDRHPDGSTRRGASPGRGQAVGHTGDESERGWSGLEVVAMVGVSRLSHDRPRGERLDPVNPGSGPGDSD